MVTQNLPKEETKTFFASALKEGANVNFNTDYSGGNAADAIYTATDTTFIEAMFITIMDAGSMNAQTYGNLAALTNGINIFYNTGSKTYINPDIPITKNGEWAILAQDHVLFVYGANEMTRAHIHFHTPIKIKNTETFGIELQDNFTGLQNYYFTIQGYTT